MPRRPRDAATARPAGPAPMTSTGEECMALPTAIRRDRLIGARRELASRDPDAEGVAARDLRRIPHERVARVDDRVPTVEGALRRQGAQLGGEAVHRGRLAF